MTRLTLLRRNILHRKIRLLLTVVSIAVAFFLFGMTSALRNNFSTAGASSTSRLIVSNKVGMFDGLPLGYVDRVGRVPGVSAVTYRSLTPAYFRERRNLVLIMAVDPATYLPMFPELGVPDTVRVSFSRDPSSILVGAALARRFGWKEGDQVPIVEQIGLVQAGGINRSFRIAGIFNGDGTTSTNVVLSHWSAYNEERPLSRDRVASIIVKSRSVAENDAVGNRIDEEFANSPDETQTMTEDAFGRSLLSQIGNLSLITRLVVGAGFFAILMIAGSTMATIVRERRQQIGVLRLIGYPPSFVLRQLLSESVAIAVIGGACGLLLANAVAAGLRSAQAGAFGRLAVTPGAASVALLMMVVFGVVVVVLPARSACRLDLSTTLKRRA